MSMETATEKFIEDAIAGGWLEGFFYQSRNEDKIAFGHKRNDSEDNPCHYRDLHQILLSPKAWEAVGKTRQWNFMHTVGSHSDDRGGESDRPCDCLDDEWKRQWHRFIDHLAEGQTIDQALSNLI